MTVDGDELTPAQVASYTRAVANFTPEPFATAANRALSAGVVVGWGALASNADAVSKGVDGLAPVFEYATAGDGFYRDGFRRVPRDPLFCGGSARSRAPSVVGGLV